MGFHAKEHLGKSHEVLGASRSAGEDICADVSNESELGRVIAKAKPDAVINAIKPPLSVDAMEKEKALTYEIDTVLPQRLAALGKKHGFTLVQISTDGFYEGAEGETYDEDAIVYPRNYYTYTKAIAEERVRCTYDNHLILRTEGVFGHDRRESNFFARMKKACKNGEEFPAAVDQYSQPIYGGELARIIGALLEKKATGTFNATGPDYVSRYELACKFRDAFGWDAKIARQSLKERKIQFPLCLKVNVGKLEEKIGKIRSLDGQVALLKEFEKTSHG